VSSLKQYFHFDNHERLHQALDYQTPAAVHWSKEAANYDLR
jgi:transposase InsO family protein